MSNLYLKTLGLILMVLLPFAGFAQSKGIQRFQIGYSFPMTKATYTQETTETEPVTGIMVKSSVSKNVKTKGGFGITLGHFFPVAKIGDRSSINIGLDFLYNLLVWDAQMVSSSGYDYSTGTYTSGTTYNISAATVHWGLPVGLDFKTGGEARLDRGSRLSMTLGTGLYPSMNVTVFEDNAGVRTKLHPYLKGEVGVFAGINWKVRALYSFGKIDYIGFSANDEINSTLISKSMFTLSLLVMPGSFKWGKDEWWN